MSPMIKALLDGGARSYEEHPNPSKLARVYGELVEVISGNPPMAVVEMPLGNRIYLYADEIWIDDDEEIWEEAP